jgi:hypothetical protein
MTVDINVLLDVFQKREPHYAASARVVAMIEEGEIDAVFPAHGITTLDYLARKHATRPDACELGPRRGRENLVKICTLTPFPDPVSENQPPKKPNP